MNLINPYRFASTPTFGSYSRKFDGINDRLALPSFSYLTGAQTICFWIYLEKTNITQDIFSNWRSPSDRGLICICSSGGNLVFYISGDGSNFINVQSSTKPTIRTWHHVAVVYEPSTHLKIYLDGVLEGTITSGVFSSIYDPSSTVSTSIGERDDDSQVTCTQGYIADVRVYNSDIGQANIQAIESGTHVTTDLVGWWLTDNDDYLDYSGNNATAQDDGIMPAFSTDAPIPSNTGFGNASRILNGSSDFLVVGDYPEYHFGGTSDNAFSVACWIKPDVANKFRMISVYSEVSPQDKEWTFVNTSNGELMLLLSATQSVNIQARCQSDNINNYIGSWVHVACTYDGRGGINAGDGIELYINGVSCKDYTTTHQSYTNMRTTNTDLTIGWLELSNATNYSDGKMADCRVYNKELSLSEVQDIESGTNVTSGLVGHWLTNNNDFLDYSSSGNDIQTGSQFADESPF